ncbi:MAG: sigma-70 family RNA polymerase sigma factor [Bacteroidetes bacterium]|nr:MAG: sigma-70 family RNA polymerase sigma factor [Bacteroidota bacterium]
MLLSVILNLLGKNGRNRLRHLVEKPDGELVKLYQSRQDMEIISVLLDRHKDAWIAVSFRYLKDDDAVRDFAGEMYLKLSEKLLTAEVGNFKSWLLTLTYNALHDLNRKGRVREMYRSGLKEETETIDTQLHKSLDNEVWVAAFRQLGEQEQQCLTLKYLEEKSYHEIMEQTGWTFNQVRGLLERAKDKLRRLLGADFNGYFKDT